MAEITQRKPRIALVEDDDDLRFLLRYWLLNAYEPAAFSCGETLLKELDALAPELVILDITLPGADGFTVACQIRSRRGYADVPILFLTGLPTAAFPSEACGVEYLAKPMARAHLLECLARLLSPRTPPARRLREPA